MSGFVPTAGQRQVIEAPLVTMLVSAGAGTGKTTVMAQRILHLLATGQARPEEVLGLTFTNKAAAGLKEKVRATLGPGVEGEHLDVAVATYHGFGAMLVARHGGLIGLAPRTRVLDRAQARQLLYSVFDEVLFENRTALFPNITIDFALDLADACANRLVAVEDLVADTEDLLHRAASARTVDTAKGRLELARVVQAYQERKRRLDLIDYGDQIVLAVELMTRHRELADTYRRQHPVVLLDEYQDTNLAQRRLLQLIYPPGSPVCAVGDDMQSIYAFRGAHRANILGFHDHFGPGPAVTGLTVTFRFGPRLVELANRLQSKVADALPKKLQVPTSDAPTPDLAPRSRRLQRDQGARSVGGGVAETEVECFLAEDASEEAATIAQDLVAAGPPWSSTAILCRKRRLVGPIASALAERGVPVEVSGGSGLLERPEVVEVISTLELLVERDNPAALLRLLQGPRYALGRGDLGALARAGRALGLDSMAAALERLDEVDGLSEEGRLRLDRLGAELTRLADLAGRLPLADLVESVVHAAGLWRTGGHRARENLLRLIAMVEDFDPVEAQPDLAGLVEYLQILADTTEPVSEAFDLSADAVRILTVHQAKGLEFDVVYVPGLAGRIFPDSRAADNPTSSAAAVGWWLSGNDEGLPDPHTTTLKAITEELRRRRLDEEWRLLYVACTRARRRLVCSAAHRYPAADLTQATIDQGPSEFYDFVAAQGDLVTERFRHAAPGSPGEGYGRVVGPDGADGQLRFDGVDPGAPPLTNPGFRRPPPPEQLSVTGLVTHQRCPRQFFWTVVRPLPRRARPAAMVGAAVHSWIQRRADPQLSLAVPDVGGPPADPAAQALAASFEESPYAGMVPERVEEAFTVDVGSHRVRGRIDAVYRHRPGSAEGPTVEVVDFKTGHIPAGDGIGAGVDLQLSVYGLAAVARWGADPARLRLSACYLRAGGPAVIRSIDWTAADPERVRADLTARLGSIATEEYDPTPGGVCRSCDFVAACDAGRGYLAGGPVRGAGDSGLGPGVHDQAFQHRHQLGDPDQPSA